MRKLFMIVAVGALALLIAAPAMALDFKFGSEYRVRFYAGENIGSLSAATKAVNPALANGSVTNPFIESGLRNPRGAQVRLRPRFDVKDDNGNIQATLRLEIGDVEFGAGGGAGSNWNAPSINVPGQRVGNGAGGSAGNDGVNVETKWAYIDAALPFGLPARVRAGIQGYYLPKGLIIDDDGAGVRIYGEIKPFSYDVWWLRAQRSDNVNPIRCLNAAGDNVAPTNVSNAAVCPAGFTTTSLLTGTAVSTTNLLDNSYDFYAFKGDVAIAPFFNPGVYYVYGRNAANPGGFAPAADTHYVGVTATGKFGIMAYDVDFVYGSAEATPAGGQGITTKGWTIDGAVHFPIGPVTLNFAATYGTGDKNDGGNAEAFPTILPAWNGPGGGFEMIGTGGAFDAVEYTQDASTNIFGIGGWATYNPVKALTLKAGYAYIALARKAGNCAATATTLSATCVGPAYTRLIGEKVLGHEVHLRADYNVWTGFKVQGQAGWLFPPEGDPAHEYILQLLYNF